jgi:hypothetical protein
VDPPAVGIAGAADGSWARFGLGFAAGIVVGWSAALAFIWKFYRACP